MTIARDVPENIFKFNKLSIRFERILWFTCDQNQETTLHISKIDSMILNVLWLSNAPTFVFFRQIFSDPFLDKTHL